jgi:hypothetical protein
MLSGLFLALAAARPANLPRARLLASTGGAGGMIGIIIGLGIWIAMLGFGIIFYLIRCKCYRICTFCCSKKDVRLPMADQPNNAAELVP